MNSPDATLTLNGTAQPHTAMSVLQLVLRETGTPATGGTAGDATTAGCPRGVAVAVNGEVVPRSAWAGTPLAAGDHVELLSAVQGG
ncbi:sulfur carrier protein ThiS [Arthrobacter sp.]|uniref:sulfur carrier protein ThiS n=1 Tax=Arthrobacter sp. TaxID=1667 RepID=UPI003A8F1089